MQEIRLAASATALSEVAALIFADGGRSELGGRLFLSLESSFPKVASAIGIQFPSTSHVKETRLSHQMDKAHQQGLPHRSTHGGCNNSLCCLPTGKRQAGSDLGNEPIFSGNLDLHDLGYPHYGQQPRIKSAARSIEATWRERMFVSGRAKTARIGKAPRAFQALPQASAIHRSLQNNNLSRSIVERDEKGKDTKD